MVIASLAMQFRLGAISNLSFFYHVTFVHEFSSTFQDYLNEKLQESFLQRIRHAMKPDEAFGLIFSWDNVIVSCFSFWQSELLFCVTCIVLERLVALSVLKGIL